MQSKRKDCLDRWLSSITGAPLLQIVSQGEILDRKSVIITLSQVSTSYPQEEFIYMLLIEQNQLLVPVYVGKTNNLSSRWNSHLKELSEGNRLYAKWKELLLGEDTTARYNTYLLLLPGSLIVEPPLEGFPTTVGAVEYQLVSLVSDSYPEFFLNHEGNRR